MHEEIVYTGALFQVVRRKERFDIPVNDENRAVDLEYEMVRRPPGVRAIIIKNGKLLLNKEFRYELNGWDYRLPGGKVFDSREQAGSPIQKKELLHRVEKALQREVLEEADLQVKSYSLYERSRNGLTVEWDLYYYIVDDFADLGNKNNRIEKKSEFEYIQSCWVDYQTALQYCLERKISEERSVGVLLRFLLSRIEKKELESVLFKKD